MANKIGSEEICGRAGTGRRKRGFGMALAGRAAVVTGGASGIVRATSLMLKKLALSLFAATFCAMVACAVCWGHSLRPSSRQRDARRVGSPHSLAGKLCGRWPIGLVLTTAKLDSTLPGLYRAVPQVPGRVPSCGRGVRDGARQAGRGAGCGGCQRRSAAQRGVSSVRCGCLSRMNFCAV